jgi:PST family polysaccharide transporter
VKQIIKKFSRNRIVQNAAALYGVQICRKLAPIVLIPYLARTLGPAAWGVVAFTQSLGEFIVLIIEFGFNLSATREIARHCESKETCGEIIAGVVGAQIMLSIAAATAAIALSRFIPILRENPRLLAAGLFYALFQGFAPLWFFQGLERIRLAAALETTGKILGVCGVLIFVRSPEDGWIALFLQGLAPAMSTIAGLTLAYRAIRFRAPSFHLIRGAFRLGWPMFVFRSAESLYGVGNAFVLGLFAPPPLVGYFASAEKITKAIFGLLNPIRDALYPSLSHMVRNSAPDAARLARTGIVIMSSGGILLGGFVFTFAPWLVRTLLGESFIPAIAILRILSLLPPMLSITYSVGLQWLLPLGRDMDVNRIILTAGVLNLTMAVMLAPRFADMGMAWAIVSAEAFVCINMVRIVARSTSLFRGDAICHDASPALTR